jgi:hypothetical protein
MPYPTPVRPMFDGGGYSPGLLKLPQMQQTTGMPPMNQTTGAPPAGGFDPQSWYAQGGLTQLGQATGQQPGGGGAAGPNYAPYVPRAGSDAYQRPDGSWTSPGSSMTYMGADQNAPAGMAWDGSHYRPTGLGDMGGGMPGGGANVNGPGFDGDAAHSAWLGQQQGGASPNVAPGFTGSYTDPNGMYHPGQGGTPATGPAPGTNVGGGSSSAGSGGAGMADQGYGFNNFGHPNFGGLQPSGGGMGGMPPGGGMGGGMQPGFGQMGTNPGGSGQSQSNANPYLQGGTGAPHASTGQPWGAGPYPGSGAPGGPAMAPMPPAAAPGYVPQPANAQAPQMPAAPQLNAPSNFGGGHGGSSANSQWSPNWGNYSANAGQANPYLQQQWQGAQSDIMRNLQEQVLPGIQSGANATGNAGSSRQGIAQGQAISGAAGQMANAGAQLFGNAFEGQQNRAAQAYGVDANTGLGYANSNNNLSLGQGQLQNQSYANQTSRDLGYGNIALGYGNLDLGFNNSNNQFNLGAGNLALGNRSADQNYGLGMFNAQNNFNLGAGGLQNQRYGMDQNFSLGQGNLNLGYYNGGNQFALGQGGLQNQRYGMDQNYNLGMTNAGNQRYGIDQQTGLGWGGLNNQANANDQNFYTQQRGLDLQSIGMGAQLFGNANQQEWSPYQNASGVYAPYTGYGSNTQTQQGGGAMGAIGGALGGWQLGSMMGGGGGDGWRTSGNGMPPGYGG